MQLRRQHLQVVPVRKLGARNAHRVDDAVVAGLRQPLARIPLDQRVVRLLVRTVARILVQAEVLVATKRLRVLARPGVDLVGVDEHLTVLDPRRELRQRLAVLVLGDAGIEPVVPVVNATDQVVVVVDVAVGHQRAAVQAATIVNTGGVVVANHDQIDLADKRVLGPAVAERVPSCYGLLAHAPLSRASRHVAVDRSAAAIITAM